MGQTLGKSVYSGFRRAVHGVLRRRQPTHNARYEYQLSAPPFQHGWQHSVGCVDNTPKIGIDYGAVILKGDRVKGSIGTPAGVVDQNINALHLLQHRCHPRLNLRRISHITRCDQYHSSGIAGGHFLAQCFKALSPPAEQHESRPSPTQQEGELSANAAAGTGNRYDLIFITAQSVTEDARLLARQLP